MAYERYTEPDDEQTIEVREWTDDNGQTTVVLRLVAEPDQGGIRIERGNGKRVSQSILVAAEDIDATIGAFEELRDQVDGPE